LADLATYAAKRADGDDQAVVWPNQKGEGRTVWVHIITTTVRNLGRCQVILVRDSRTAPVTEVRFWASSELSADDCVYGQELWLSDGSMGGTRQVADIRPGWLGSNPEGLVRLGDLALFAADDGTHGRELWALSISQLTQYYVHLHHGAVVRVYR
jgi:ELWxxDGT repeat protein